MKYWRFAILLPLLFLGFNEYNPYRMINSFNAGELSELLIAREDLSKYHSGGKQVENAIVLPQGGA